MKIFLNFFINMLYIFEYCILKCFDCIFKTSDNHKSIVCHKSCIVSKYNFFVIFRLRYMLNHNIARTGNTFTKLYTIFVECPHAVMPYLIRDSANDSETILIFLIYKVMICEFACIYGSMLIRFKKGFNIVVSEEHNTYFLNFTIRRENQGCSTKSFYLFICKEFKFT